MVLLLTNVFVKMVILMMELFKYVKIAIIAAKIVMELMMSNV